jgi:hypothetical protein
MCLAGASGAGAELLRAIPDTSLRAYCVWVPMLPSDNKAAARAAAERFAEPRAVHYWDGDRHLSRQLAVALGIETRRSAAAGDDPAFAWDVYLAYRRGNRDLWAPDSWMHQLAVEHAPTLDVDVFRERVNALLESDQRST